MSAQVARLYTFNARHRVPNAAAPWNEEHGHRYTVEVVLGGPVGAKGMIVDTDLIDNSWRFMAGRYEDQDLNTVHGEYGTTVEALAATILADLREEVEEVVSVTVWEDASRWGSARAGASR